MKNIALALLLSVSAHGQGVLKTLYQDSLKYGTVYAAGDISNSYVQDRNCLLYTSPSPRDQA